VGAVGGVVEDHGVLAHQVVDVARAAGQRDVVLDDRVEAEEDLFAVEDVELEQRRAGVGADLRVGVLDETEADEFLHGVQDGMGMPRGQPVHTGPVVGVVAKVVDPAGQHHGSAGVGSSSRIARVAGLFWPMRSCRGVPGLRRGGFRGESGEVDGDVLAGEGLLDERAQADRGCGEDWWSGRTGVAP
jgi:hypothetical protein